MNKTISIQLTLTESYALITLINRILIRLERQSDIEYEKEFMRIILNKIEVEHNKQINLNLKKLFTQPGD